MNNDLFLNKLAQCVGVPKKQVIDVLKIMSNMPEVQSRLHKPKKGAKK